jgi:hypothetical protein
MATSFPSRLNSASTIIPIFGSWGECHTFAREKGNCCPSTISNPDPDPGSRRTLPRFLVSPVGHRKSANAVTEDARICISLLLHRCGIAGSIAAFGLQWSTLSLKWPRPPTAVFTTHCANAQGKPS